MSKASQSGLSCIVRSLATAGTRKGLGQGSIAAEVGSISAKLSISNGARIGFYDQAGYPEGNGAASGIMQLSQNSPVLVSSSSSSLSSLSAPPSSTSSSSSSNSSRSKYHSHSHSNHTRHRQHPSHPQPSLLPSFWIQPPSSPTSSLLFGSAANTTSAASSSLSSSHSSPQHSSSPASSTPPSSAEGLNDQDVRIPPKKPKIHTAHLTLLHGAYGIPKRPGIVKGKVKELDSGDPTADQIVELEQPLLSVQVGEVRRVCTKAFKCADGNWTRMHIL